VGVTPGRYHREHVANKLTVNRSMTENRQREKFALVAQEDRAAVS
jgi:hypothetical protein